MTQQVGNHDALPEDHPFRVLAGPDVFPQTLGDPEPAAVEPAPAPAPAAPPAVDPEVERLRAATASQQQLIDRLLDRALAQPVAAPAAPAPPQANDPGPMPDPSDPDAFQRWLDATVDARAQRIAGVAVGEVRALRSQLDEQATLNELWGQIQGEEPELAKHADLFGLVWQAEGGRLNGRDPEAVKARVVNRVRSIVAGTSAAPAPAADPAPTPAPAASRTAGLSGPGAAPRAAAAPNGPTQDRGMIGDIEEIQANSGYY